MLRSAPAAYFRTVFRDGKHLDAAFQRSGMDLGFDGDTAIVAASSSGLGKATATALAREGANVLINGRDEERLAAAADDIRQSATGDVVPHAADLTNPAAVSGLVDRAVSEFGGLDHLVTNAGGPPSGRFLDTADEEWYDAFELLVMSAVRLVRESAPHLEAEDGGTISMIASRSVKEAIDALVLSNSVRAGVVGLEKTLASELAPEIRTNAVLPGSHETPRIEELVNQAVDRGDYPDYESGLEGWAEGVPLERVGDPSEFGNVVAFLASDRASYINGSAIIVDGGAVGATL